MSLTLDENHAIYQIRGYEPGRIQINQIFYTQSLILSPFEMITDAWPPHTVTDLKPIHFEMILAHSPAILLIGTGSTLQFPPAEVYSELINQGIGIEVMNTFSACRTFNALTAEDRNVIAALML